MIGGPGAGKSSLLKHLVLTLSSRWLTGEPASYVPVRIPAEALVPDRPFANALAAAVTQELGGTSVQAHLPDFFASPPVADTPWLVMVDGIDEILDQQLRFKVLKIIASHRDSQAYKFLVASRPLANDELRLIVNPNLPTYFIEPFSESLLPVLAATWFEALQVDDPQRLLADFKRKLENYNLRQLTRIPLIATMTCIVFVSESKTLPVSRSDLYAKFVDYLFAKRWSQLDLRERLKLRVPAHVSDGIAAVDALVDTLLPALCVAACERQKGGRKSVMTYCSAKFETLRPTKIEPELWNELVREALRHCGLLVDQGGIFVFLHQSIEEYLAASELATWMSTSDRRRADLLLGVGEGSHLRENVRLFLASIWQRRDNDFNGVIKRIIKRDSPGAASFIASVVLDGGFLPEDLMTPAYKLLSRRLGLRTYDSNGFLSLEAIELVAEARRISLLTKRALDPQVDLVERFAAVLQVTSLNDPAAIRRIRFLAERGESNRLRAIAARVLAATGVADSTNLLVSMVKDLKWPIGDRIAALGELEYIDRQLSQELFVSFARDPTVPAVSRVEAAAQIIKYDMAAAENLMIEMSYSDERSVEYREMLAWYLLSCWDHPRGLVIYNDLARDRRVSSYVRFGAAQHISGYDRSAAKNAMLSIATDDLTEPPLRMKLASFVNPDDVPRIYRAVALDEHAQDVYRVEALRAMVRIAPQEAVKVMGILVEDESLTESVRVTLAQMIRPPASG